MTKIVKVCWLLFQSRLTEMIEYRLNFLVWMIIPGLQMLLIFSVWSYFRPESFTDHLWQFYVLTGLISGFTMQSEYAQMSKDIRTGFFSYYLVQPFPYFMRFISSDLASSVLRIVLISFTIWLISREYLSIVQLSVAPIHILMGLPMLLLGRIMASLVFFLMGCITFIWTQPNSLYLVLEIILPLFVGAKLPLWLLADHWLYFLNFLPTRWMVSMPAEILVGLPISFGSVLFSGIIWMVLLSILSWFIWRHVLVLYEAVGS